MKQFPGKSVYSIHKSIAKDQFKELKYEGEDKIQMMRSLIYQYFESRTKRKNKNDT